MIPSIRIILLHAEVEHDEDLTEKGWFPGMTKKSGDDR